jgi:Group II intron, maturase-specific domain
MPTISSSCASVETPKDADPYARTDGKTEADGQRGEDTDLYGTGRELRVLGLHVWAALQADAYLGMRPSKKSIRHMIETVHALTVEAMVWQETTALVDKLNRTLRGWANYFQVGTVNPAYRAIDTYTTCLHPGITNALPPHCIS